MAQPLRPTRSLHNKVAIVTGAGAIGEGIGNGRAAAILLAADGCSVVCVDLDLPLAERTVSMIQAEGKGSAIALAANVSLEEDCKRIVDFTVQTYGRLDILINNVGIHGARGNAVEVDMEGWAAGMQVNVGSVVMMSKFAIPVMIRNGPGGGEEKEGEWRKDGVIRGSIVNLGSVAGMRGGAPDLLYSTTKGAIAHMTKVMAAHHAGWGIRVNCVSPGQVFTPRMYENNSSMTDEVRQNRAKRSLLQVEGNGWDVGAAIRWLAGDEARWITGINLPVEAGAIAAVGTGQKLGHAGMSRG